MEFAYALEKLGDALEWLVGFSNYHPSNSNTILPSIENMLNTLQIDSFVLRALRFTNPPCVREHNLLTDWWAAHVKPKFARI